MITETTMRDKNPGVDYASINLQKEVLAEDSISSRDLFISNTAAIDKFSEIESNENRNHNHEERVAEEICVKNNRITTIIPSCRTGISILMELPLKIMNGVTEMLNFQSNNSPDSEIPAKRPYSPRPYHHSSKQTPTDIARGRGRGRGRSQLRRSGVSQTRHRQERIRHRLSADIQDDLEDLREFDDLEENIEDEIPGTPCVDDKGQRIRYGADGAEAETTSFTKYPFFFSYCDTKKRKRKQRNNKNANDNQRATITNNCKVRYIPECPIDIANCKKANDVLHEDIESDNRMNRKRLQSDISVDSEDSCCIVFENGSESDYETHLDYTTTDDEDEEDDDNDQGTRLKVRFAQNPKIHTIIAWDYAYRAARRGPWEEMARDRERFKYRVNCIARVLDPILVPQHRSEIWQHRFAVEM